MSTQPYPIQFLDTTVNFFPMTDSILSCALSIQKKWAQRIAICTTYFSRPIDYLIQIFALPIFFCIGEVYNLRLESKKTMSKTAFAIQVGVIHPLELLAAAVVLIPANLFRAAYRLLHVRRFAKHLWNPDLHIKRYFLCKREKIERSEGKTYHILRIPKEPKQLASLTQVDEQFFYTIHSSSVD